MVITFWSWPRIRRSQGNWRPWGASDLLKAKSSGKDPRATGGLVSNLPHPRVNKTEQRTLVKVITGDRSWWHIPCHHGAQIERDCSATSLVLPSNRGSMDTFKLSCLLLWTFSTWCTQRICLLNSCQTKKCANRYWLMLSACQKGLWWLLRRGIWECVRLTHSV